MSTNVFLVSLAYRLINVAVYTMQKLFLTYLCLFADLCSYKRSDLIAKLIGENLFVRSNLAGFIYMAKNRLRSSRVDELIHRELGNMPEASDLDL